MRRLLVFASFVFACSPPPEESDARVDSELAQGPLAHDVARGNRIAETALRMNGRASRNLCLFELQNSLERAGVKKLPRLPGAVDLDNFLSRQGGGLLAWGFQKQARRVDDLPRGSIIAWRPGQCGYHPTYGHIEIVVGGGRACSDFCGSIKRECGLPNVYVPVISSVDAATATDNAMTARCDVDYEDKKLRCSNKRDAALHAAPNAESPVVNRLKTTSSWFECWGRGEEHSPHNSTWYFTIGDENPNRGWVPANLLETGAEFDANPTARGLRMCEGHGTQNAPLDPEPTDPREPGGSATDGGAPEPSVSVTDSGAPDAKVDGEPTTEDTPRAQTPRASGGEETPPAQTPPAPDPQQTVTGGCAIEPVSATHGFGSAWIAAATAAAARRRRRTVARAASQREA